MRVPIVTALTLGAAVLALAAFQVGRHAVALAALTVWSFGVYLLVADRWPGWLAGRRHRMKHSLIHGRYEEPP